MSHLPYRLEYSLFGTPSLIKPALERCWADIGLPSPLSERLGLPSCVNNSVRSAVVCLGHNSSPSAIIRSVVAIIVNSVNRMLRGWPVSHVIVKGLERLSPSSAKTNASFSIIREIMVRLAKASFLNAAPRSVLRRSIHPMSFTSFRSF